MLRASTVLRSALIEHRAVADACEASVSEPFDQLARLSARTLSMGGKIVLFGNGGSAADAQHIAAELVVRFQVARRAMAAIALTTDTSILTAVANDISFDQIFARQVEALMRPGDLAIGLSTSGRSANVLAGLAAARACGGQAAGMTGADGHRMAELASPLISVPSRVTARIQEMHILLGHALCDYLEQSMHQASEGSAPGL